MYKRISFLLLCLFIFWTKNTFSQASFFKTYGKIQPDVAYSMQKTLDGGYILSGISNGYGGGNGLFFVKTDANGDTSMIRGYTTNNTVFGMSVFACSDSSFAVCGNSGFARVDKKGSVLWDFVYNTVSFYSIQQTKDKGFILAGGIGQTNGSNGQDVYLLKIDSLGTKQWSRKLGGPIDEYATCIRQTPDGGYIFAGNTDSYGAGGWDIYVIKINALGDTLWTKTYGGTLTEGGISGARASIEYTFDKGFIIGAYTTSFGSGGTDAYLIKIDSTGNIQWSKTYGGSGSELIYDVKQTRDSGYVFVGYTSTFGAGSTDIYVVKTNSLGDTLFTRAFGGGLAESGQGIVQTADRGFAICGYTATYGSGNNDALLLKIDSLGNGLCHQNNTNTIVNNPATLMGNTTTGKIFITLFSNSVSPLVKSGGKVTDACVVNAIETNKENSGIKIFPNPNNGNFTVYMQQNNTQQFTLSVNTILGETVYSNRFSGANKTEINLAHLPAGTYLLRLNSNDSVYTQQIFIAR